MMESWKAEECGWGEKNSGSIAVSRVRGLDGVSLVGVRANNMHL